MHKMMTTNDTRKTKDYLKDFSTNFNKTLIKLIPNRKSFSDRLYEAMVYVVKVGGKRLRPVFLTEIAGLLGATKNSAIRTAAGIEFIHCYSLVHDDLPAMDDDDLRRGHMTCHKKFDDATAILVGDAFQALAFEIIADKKTHPSSEVRVELVSELSKCCGCCGMVKGQMLDLVAEKKKLNLQQILELQKLKTGELFRFACLAGCILKEDIKHIKTFSKFSRNLGIAFQIRDDLLDVEGIEKQVGKRIKKDSKKGKQTIISLTNISEAKELCEKLIAESISLLKPFGKKADQLKKLTNFVISREN